MSVPVLQRSAHSSRGLRLSNMDVGNSVSILVLGLCCAFPSGAQGSVWVIKMSYLLTKDLGMSV